jgi:hypothetical protein
VEHAGKRTNAEAMEDRLAELSKENAVLEKVILDSQLVWKPGAMIVSSIIL